MVWGHQLQLRSHPPLLHNFWQFHVKVAAAHHPIAQKEGDELFAKGAIKPFSGGAGFYSSVVLVPRHTGGLWPILNLKHLNHYMHMPSCVGLSFCCIIILRTFTFSLSQNITVVGRQAFMLYWALHQVWEQPNKTALICVAKLNWACCSQTWWSAQ